MADDEHLVKAYTLESAEIAEIIRAALETDGIKCSIANEHQAGLTGVMPIDIMVLESDYDAAHKLIVSHLENQNQNEDEDED